MKQTIEDLNNFLDKNAETWTPRKSINTYSLLCILEHERFLHLLVTLFTFAGVLYLAAMSLVVNGILIRILGTISTILLCCYIHYYWYLENSLQTMYYKICKLDRLLVDNKYETN